MDATARGVHHRGRPGVTLGLVAHRPPGPRRRTCARISKAPCGVGWRTRRHADVGRGRGRGLRMSAVQALFREYIGIPPQSLSRVIRFQYALRIPSQGYRSLAELAAINGYHDQAHTNRDFRAPAGRTPGQLRPFADRATLAGGTGHDSRFTDRTSPSWIRVARYTTSKVQTCRVLEIGRIVLHPHRDSVLLDHPRPSLSGVQNPGSRPKAG
ncbi:helix-turn-helix domain-containing protein [Streptomyces sp. NPDC055097]